MQELERRRRRQRAAYHDTAAFGHENGRRDFEAEGADDRWKDQVIIAVGLIVRLSSWVFCMVWSSPGAQSLAIALGPALIFGGPSDHHHRSAAANLAQARAEAREFGEQRRLEIKRRVKEYEEQAALQDSERRSDSAK